MKKKYIAIVAVLALVVIAGGIVVGRTIAHTLAAPAPDQAEPTATVPSPSPAAPSAAPSFEVPKPLPTGAVGQTGGEVQSVDAAPTITEDEDGNVTIVPNWEAKAQYAHPVDKAPEANMGGSGGGEMDMTDGVYLGDHPGEETPAPTPKTTAAPTPAPTPAATPAPSATPAVTPALTEKPDGETQTPDDGNQQPANPTPAPNNAPDPVPPDAPSKPSGGPPSDDGSHNDGDISPDGRYDYWEGFGWVERGEGSYSTFEDGEYTELTGNAVGEM